MKKKIIPTEATYEELLSAMQEEGDDESVSDLDISKLTDDSVLIFLTHFNIKSGTNAVNSRLIYDLYKKHTLNPVDKRIFSGIVSKYVTSYSNKKGTFYQINMDAFKVTEEILKLKVKKSKSKEKSITYRRSFEKFLSECEITHGQYWLQGFIIYEIYLDYCKNKGLSRPHYSFQTFIQMLKVYFEGSRRTSNRSLWFNVNEKTYKKYTKEQRDEIEARRRKKKR